MIPVSRWKKAVAAAWIAAGLLAGAGICAHRAEAHVPAVCSVMAQCPEHLPVIERFIAAYSVPAGVNL